MPVTKKIDVQEKKAVSENANKKQINDIFSTISKLGTKTEKISNQTEHEKNSYTFEITDKDKSVLLDDFKTVTKKAPEENDEKPGYISLVVSNNLKKKWKVYVSEHGMSMTDCIKLSMKLLEDMESSGKIKVDDGIIIYNN